MLVNSLGVKSDSTAFVKSTLSTGVVLVSKPSKLHVPPWQFMSAVLGGASIRTATWWTDPGKIYTTPASKKMDCWDNSLGKPGRVEVATSGSWNNIEFGLEGHRGADYNHAKIGVSISNAKHLSIFGDLNQDGAISGINCGASQNGRGGIFFVVEDKDLTSSLTALIDGDTAPTKAPTKAKQHQ